MKKIRIYKKIIPKTIFFEFQTKIIKMNINNKRFYFGRNFPDLYPQLNQSELTDLKKPLHGIQAKRSLKIIFLSLCLCIQIINYFLYNYKISPQEFNFGRFQSVEISVLSIPVVYCIKNSLYIFNAMGILQLANLELIFYSRGFRTIEDFLAFRYLSILCPIYQLLL